MITKKKVSAIIWAVIILSTIIGDGAAFGNTVSIGNQKIVRTLRSTDGVWKTTAFSRTDGSDTIKVDSDEFHILFFDGKTVTIEQYKAVGRPVISDQNGLHKLVIRYEKRKDMPVPQEAPDNVIITYSISDADLFMRKTVEFTDDKLKKQIDRLEVERFSTPVKATRGGRGQPVFLDDKWFAGIEHPSACSRHTDGNTPAEYQEPWGHFGAWFGMYKHSLQGRDITKTPRPGLVRLFHFPPYPKLRSDGKYHLKSKPAVIGTSAPGDPLELGFMDYFRTIALKPKRLSHYNNWFDSSGKNLTISNFVGNVLATYNRHFSKYGVSVDSMCADNFNWHVNASFYHPNPRWFPHGDSDMRRLNDALKKNGSCLGLWLALSGNNGMSSKWAREHGYQWGPGGHFILSNAKNKAAMKKRLKELLVDVGVNYFKHDFNTLKSQAPGNGYDPSARHGHEAEVDAMFELLDWEIKCNPKVFINITNGAWFSPWLLARCHSIWMLSHDDGAGQSGPEPSNFVHNQSYRDEVIYQPWGHPETRPLIPISQLMTHGIICTPHTLNNYNNIEKDSLQGWASGVMLYYMRGTLLQEWYITPGQLSPKQWDALGRTSRWFKENEDILANTVFWGGNPAESEPFGYVAWNGDKGIVSMRNSLPTPQKVSIPFDKSVWYRGKEGVSYKADVVFPWQNEWPQTFVAGRPLEITIPPYTLMVMHLSPGRSGGKTAGNVGAVAVKHHEVIEDGQLKRVDMTVPGVKMKNCELMVTAYGSSWPDIKINGKSVSPSRESWSTYWRGKTDKWRVRCFDLLPYLGQAIEVEISADALPGKDIFCDMKMIQDLAVKELPDSGDVRLPLPVSQGARRAVAVMFSKVLLAKSAEPENHLLFGLWKYESGGKAYSREFRKDGICVLRQGNQIIWQKKYTILSDNVVRVNGDALHEYKKSASGKAYMDIGKGRYRAER